MDRNLSSVFGIYAPGWLGVGVIITIYAGVALSINGPRVFRWKIRRSWIGSTTPTPADGAEVSEFSAYALGWSEYRLLLSFPSSEDEKLGESEAFSGVVCCVDAACDSELE
ncbi:MAG: hypothetical protein Q9226_003526 [Calogaya cf. arnoldii]